MSDLKDFSNLKFNADILKDIQAINPLNNINSRNSGMQQSLQELANVLNQSKNTKEQEELRRHNELILALRSAAKNGATIVVGDNANGI